MSRFSFFGLTFSLHVLERVGDVFDCFRVFHHDRIFQWIHFLDGIEKQHA